MKQKQILTSQIQKENDVRKLNTKIKAVVIAASVMVCSGSVFAETLMWSDNAQDAYGDLDWRAWYSNSRFQQDENGNEIPYNKKIQLVGLKNTSRVLTAFSDFNIRRVIGKSDSGRTVYTSTIGTESCQCVAFVKTMTGYIILYLLVIGLREIH